jgi:leucyl-tRNA synthetase
MEDVITNFGSDSTRIALAQAGDTLDDANFTLMNSDSAILQLSTLEMWIRETVKNFQNYREKPTDEKIEFFDLTFQNEMNQLLIDAIEAYETMRFRDALKNGFFELQTIKDDYKLNVGTSGVRKDLILQYLEYQLLLLYPIAPHFCEIMYRDCFYELAKERGTYPKYLSLHKYPKVIKSIFLFYFFLFRSKLKI